MDKDAIARISIAVMLVLAFISGFTVLMTYISSNFLRTSMAEIAHVQLNLNAIGYCRATIEKDQPRYDRLMIARDSMMGIE